MGSSRTCGRKIRNVALRNLWSPATFRWWCCREIPSVCRSRGKTARRAQSSPCSPAVFFARLQACHPPSGSTARRSHRLYPVIRCIFELVLRPIVKDSTRNRMLNVSRAKVTINKETRRRILLWPGESQTRYCRAIRLRKSYRYSWIVEADVIDSTAG